MAAGGCGLVSALPARRSLGFAAHSSLRAPQLSGDWQAKLFLNPVPIRFRAVRRRTWTQSKVCRLQYWSVGLAGLPIPGCARSALPSRSRSTALAEALANRRDHRADGSSDLPTATRSNSIGPGPNIATPSPATTWHHRDTGGNTTSQSRAMLTTVHPRRAPTSVIGSVSANVCAVLV